MAFGEKAQKVFIPISRIRKGPPAPYARWSPDAILALLRKSGIDVENFINYFKVRSKTTRAVQGYTIYYKGDAPRETSIARLH